jgi:hypothetical protein
MADDSAYVRGGGRAADEQAAAAANAKAVPSSVQTSAAGLGALANKIAAQKAAQRASMTPMPSATPMGSPTPAPSPTTAPVNISTPMQMGHGLKTKP